MSKAAELAVCDYDIIHQAFVVIGFLLLFLYLPCKLLDPRRG